MKEQTIKAMTAAGVSAEKAEKYWATVRDKLCDGDEPTAEGLALIKDSSFEAALPALGAAAFLKAIRGAAPEKARRFKADKARSYTAAELVGFHAADPKNEDVKAELLRRTGGEDFRFVVDGKLREAETAARVEAIFQRDPRAPFVTIDGKRVAPVGFDLETKEDDEDPFDRGVALGQPGDVSARLGISLAGVSHEARQALAHAMDHDLRDASLRELQQAARAAVGKTMTEVLGDYPKASLGTFRPRTLKIARRPFADPTAASTAPRGGHEAPVESSSHEVFDALIAIGADRRALLAGLHPSFVASLTTAPSPAAQLSLDVAACREARMADGSSPYRQLLENAAHLAGPRREALVFRAALSGLSPLVYAITGGHRTWDGLRLHFTPMVRGGLFRLESDVSARPGEDTARRHARMVSEAAALLVLVFPGALTEEVESTIRAAKLAGKRVIPVLVGSLSLDCTVLAGAVLLPRHGRSYSGDSDGAAIATELRQILSK